jgi:nucleotide-binding universal stress UspA family protein
MGYANIIAVLSGAPDDRTTLSAAAGLAKRSNGLVRIVMALPVEAASVWADAFGGAYFAPQTVQAIVEANTQIRRRTAELGQEIAAQNGLAFGAGAGGGRIDMAELADTAWTALLREAPMADLVVMGDSLIRVDGFWSGVTAEALLFARVPTLIVRSGKPLTAEVAAIAWDGSLPAGRAVRAAMPLLEAAEKVVILQDPDGLSAAEQDAGSPDKLKEELLRRGLKTVTITEAAGGREGPRLLKAAKSVGAGLVVSGAYGHSRLGEAVFGGATRAFVQAHTDAHHFLAH